MPTSAKEIYNGLTILGPDATPTLQIRVQKQPFDKLVIQRLWTCRIGSIWLEV